MHCTTATAGQGGRGRRRLDDTTTSREPERDVHESRPHRSPYVTTRFMQHVTFGGVSHDTSRKQLSHHLLQEMGNDIDALRCSCCTCSPEVTTPFIQHKTLGWVSHNTSCKQPSQHTLPLPTTLPKSRSRPKPHPVQQSPSTSN